MNATAFHVPMELPALIYQMGINAYAKSTRGALCVKKVRE